MNADKPVEAQNVPTKAGTDFSRGQVSHDQIAQRARKLWQERSSPIGEDEAIWFEAEAQLKAEFEAKPVAGTESRPYIDEPGKQLRSHTKTQDPTDSAAQTRSPTDAKSKHAAGKLRNQ